MDFMCIAMCRREVPGFADEIVVR